MQSNLEMMLRFERNTLYVPVRFDAHIQATAYKVNLNYMRSEDHGKLRATQYLAVFISDHKNFAPAAVYSVNREFDAASHSETEA